MDMTSPILELTGIDKQFAGVSVLRDVQLRLFPGEIHALMGQNGAGKSTLIKVLTGVYSADRGEMVLAGQVHVAAARFENTGQDLDQRRLASAVLPHQRMDLAGVQAQLHIAQHADASELLVDASELKDRSHLGLLIYLFLL